VTSWWTTQVVPRLVDTLLDNDTVQGFEVGALDNRYAPGPRPFGYLYLGWATAG
jgi:hypothetical protein